MILDSQIFLFSIRLYIQYQKLYGISASFSTLSLLYSFWPKIGPKVSRNDHLVLVFGIFQQNSYSVSQNVQKIGPILLSRPSRTFLAFLDLNRPKVRSKTPRNDPKGQILIFSSKIYAQCLRLCRKVALFGSLSLLEQFWPKIGPKMRLKMARKEL